MNIHVSNLSLEIVDESLNATFAAHGKVDSASIALDGFTKRSRGFGYVEMPDNTEALQAISSLNGAVIGGRNIVVRKAMPQQSYLQGSYPARKRELK